MAYPFSNFGVGARNPHTGGMPWWREKPADFFSQRELKASYLDRLEQEVQRWEEYSGYMEPIYRQMFEDPTSQMMLPQMEAQFRSQLAPQLDQMRRQGNLSLEQRGLDTRRGGAHEAAQLQRKGTQAQAWGDYATGVGQQAEQISKQGLQGLQQLQASTPGAAEAIKALSPIEQVDIAGQSQMNIQTQVESIKQQMMSQQDSGGGSKGFMGMGGDKGAGAGGMGMLGGAGIGALAAIPTGGLSIPAGAMIGAGVGGGLGMGIGSASQGNAMGATMGFGGAALAGGLGLAGGAFGGLGSSAASPFSATGTPYYTDPSWASSGTLLM